MSENLNKETESGRQSAVDAVVSFTEWNNGDIEIDDEEWFIPIFADKVIVSTGERSMSSRVVGYRGRKSGLVLGAWAGNALEM